jgi:hypothetical protein
MTRVIPESDGAHYRTQAVTPIVAASTRTGDHAMAAPARFGEHYHAYLLRLTRAGANQPWEILAKDVETGEEYPLADSDALIAFLAERVPTLERRK